MGGKLTAYADSVALTDGAWGTELQRRGLPAGACPDLWNAENPEVVEALARRYVDAGAEIILTNTFRANRLALAHWGAGERAEGLAEAGAALSRRAAGGSAAVFGSVGPTGKMLMLEEATEEEMVAAFGAQAAALARGGADAIVCETFADPAEALLAARAVRERTDLPVVVSLTFDSGPEGTATMMGATPGDLAAAAEAAGVDAVGANCGAGPERFVRLVELFRRATALPVWVKPNAGVPVSRGTETIFPTGPEAFAAFGPPLVAAGANFIGGCCGTTPEHIRALRAAVKD